jgi:hypothetical protein
VIDHDGLPALTLRAGHRSVRPHLRHRLGTPPTAIPFAEVTAAAATQGLHVAESRERTRKRLLDVALEHACDTPGVAAGTWAALEQHLKVSVTENVPLGSATTDTDADLWDRESVGWGLSEILWAGR